MKIAIITSRFPYPLEKGDKLRIFFQMQALAARHELVLFAVTDEIPAPSEYEAVAALCSKIYLYRLPKITTPLRLLRAISTQLPFQVAYFYDKKIKKQLQTDLMTEAPAHIYCQLIRMTEYVKDIKTIPKTLDYMDTFSVGAARWASTASFFIAPLLENEAHRLKEYEKAVYPFFQAHTIISAQDRDLLNLPEKLIHIVPNGVDTVFFSPSEEKKTEYEVVFVGNMGYPPNIEAAKYLVEQVMPLVWQHQPTTKILIAGARPAPAVLRLANDRVIVSGWLADIRDAYQNGEVFAAPLFLGSGQQNKILEAMAMGVPCVTTPLVNNAIGGIPEKDILLAETADRFAESILDLLQNKSKAQLIAANARQLVVQKYSWKGSGEELERIFKKLA